jgi:hypothetical protein
MSDMPNDYQLVAAGGEAGETVSIPSATGWRQQEKSRGGKKRKKKKKSISKPSSEQIEIMTQ